MKKSISKIIMSGCLVLSLAAASLVGLQVKAGVTDSESYLTKMLKNKYPDIQIADRYYDDFDGDGKNELFVLSGSGYDLDADSAVYFSSENMIGVLETNIGYICFDEKTRERVISVGGNKKIFSIETSWGGSDTVTHCYYVKDGVAKIPSKSVSGLVHISGKKFMIYQSAFDALKVGSDSPVGHTYKMYYVKWTGSTFKEYTSKFISQADFKKYSGGASILKKAKDKGYTIDKIIERSNGIININLHKYKKSDKTTYYDNLTVKLKDGGVKLKKIDANGSTFAEKYSYGGKYKKYILK